MVDRLVIMWFRVTRFRAASGGSRLPFGFEEAFKGEEAFKEGNVSIFFLIFRNLKVLYFYIHPWVIGSP